MPLYSVERIYLAHGSVHIIPCNGFPFLGFGHLFLPEVVEPLSGGTGSKGGGEDGAIISNWIIKLVGWITFSNVQ